MRLYGVVVVCLDDSRSEESIAVGWHNQTQVHKPAQPDAVVLQNRYDIAGCDGALSRIVALVGLQARLDERPLLFG